MPLGFSVTRGLAGRSERVKSVEIHPHEPWVLAGLYSGHVFIWNMDTGVVVRSFEVSDVPIRCAKFIVRKKWIVCGSDDMFVRVYNYNTHEKIHEWEAHTDYIRSIAVHPTLPHVLTSSDDMSIKLWDWDKQWENSIIFEGHTHYVMQIEVNPKESNTFASASLDRTIKIWGLNSVNPHFSLEGHERGVNCVSYYTGGDRPFLVSGADDYMVKVWDYQTKTCVATLEGHTSNVSAVCFHPNLPIILSGSEDNTVRIWHSSTYGWEDSLNYQMERVWSINALVNSNKIAIGYDLGTVTISLGKEEPAMSMDRAGKITFAKGNELYRKVIDRNQEHTDGEVLQLPEKEMCSTDVYPQYVKHNANGRLLAVCGDGEYTIFTALKLSNRSYGNALEFVWSDRADTYATREAKGKIKLFKKFKEVRSMRLQFAAEGIFGGHLLGIKSEEFIDFYDWDELRIVRRLEVVPDKIYWSDRIAVMVCPTQMYVLEFNEDLVKKYFREKIETDEQGIEGSFDLVSEINEKVTSGCFEGDVFFYTNNSGRLNYLVGQKHMTLAHLDKKYYLLNYFKHTNHVYMMDKNYGVVAFKLSLELLAYQVAIVREAFEEAAELLEEIPEEHHLKLARFLEQNGHLELALDVTTDPDHKFELSISLKRLAQAREVIEESPAPEKWKQLTDAALQEFDFELATECAEKSDDLSTLLLIYSSLGKRKELTTLGHRAREAGRFNIAFSCFYLTHQVQNCLDLLLHGKRYAEASMFARSFIPSKVNEVVALWKEQLVLEKPECAKKITLPATNPELWPHYEKCVEIEEKIRSQNFAETPIPSEKYPDLKDKFQRDLLGASVVSVPKEEPVQEQPEPEPEPEPEPAVEPEPEPEIPETKPEPPAEETETPEDDDLNFDDDDENFDLGFEKTEEKEKTTEIEAEPEAEEPLEPEAEPEPEPVEEAKPEKSEKPAKKETEPEPEKEDLLDLDDLEDDEFLDGDLDENLEDDDFNLEEGLEDASLDDFGAF